MAQTTSPATFGTVRLAGPAPRATFLPGLALGALAGSVGMVLLVAVLTCASGLARAAEPVPRNGGAPVRIKAEEVPGRLSARGYAITAPVVRRGSTYLTHASDRQGQRLRLVMDAQNGEIIGLRVLGGQAPGSRR